MATDINIIFGWFETGKEPTQEQFRQTFLSFFHKDEKIPIDAVFELIGLLDAKAEKEQFDAHLTDPDAHTELFAHVATPHKQVVFVPEADSTEIEIPELIGGEFNYMICRNQIITDDVNLDPVSGILSDWEFKTGVKYIINYTKL